MWTFYDIAVYGLAALGLCSLICTIILGREAWKIHKEVRAWDELELRNIIKLPWVE
jgi:hypothetical protein